MLFFKVNYPLRVNKEWKLYNSTHLTKLEYLKGQRFIKRKSVQY